MIVTVYTVLFKDKAKKIGLNLYKALASDLAWMLAVSVLILMGVVG